VTADDPSPARVPGQADAAATVARFAVAGRLLSLAPHTSGLINHSWVATFEGPEGRRRYLLQQINRHVFHHPDEVMENMERVTRQVALRLSREGVPDAGRRVLSLVPTREGSPCHVDAAGETWRLVPWIEGTRATEHAASEGEARETARAFGRFLAQLQDLPGPPLHETIPGFHDTEARLAAFERALAADRASRVASCRAEIEALLERRSLARALSEPAARGEIPVRPTHNDAKIANVLFDEATGEALCVVDLDTVMPGLALHDYGDLVRSAASEAPEDARDPSRVRLSLPLFREVTRGWLGPMAGLLTAAEVELMPLAPRVIALELAIRFLTDYLEGDHYFRIERPGHNLDRCRAQLALVTDLEHREAAMTAVVRETVGG